MKKLVPFAVVAAISLGLARAALAQGGSRQSFTGTFTSTAPGSPTAYRLAIDYRNPRDPEAKPHAVACLAPRRDGGRGPEPTELPAHSSAVPRLGSLTNTATFTYRDGVSQTVATFSRCAPARTVRGSAADDVLVGSSERDVIRCGSGNDRVDGRGGDDVIDCGSGDDVVLGGGETIACSAGQATISFVAAR
ncbi:MAG TPA: hypothetical protein VK387_09355 [Thermoleophilaceae bacterium]|nr:hypothetical protein [Thermoleophilaceae bacterium]